VVGQLAQAEHAALGSGELPGEFSGSGQRSDYGCVCGKRWEERRWEGSVYGGGQEKSGVSKGARDAASRTLYTHTEEQFILIIAN